MTSLSYNDILWLTTKSTCLLVLDGQTCHHLTDNVETGKLRLHKILRIGLVIILKIVFENNFFKYSIFFCCYLNLVFFMFLLIKKKKKPNMFYVFFLFFIIKTIFKNCNQTDGITLRL